jgi:hypothetical protein
MSCHNYVDLKMQISESKERTKTLQAQLDKEAERIMLELEDNNMRIDEEFVVMINDKATKHKPSKKARVEHLKQTITEYGLEVADPFVNQLLKGPPMETTNKKTLVVKPTNKSSETHKGKHVLLG